MLIVGIVGVVSIVFGIIGSCRVDCCLTLYLWVGIGLTLGAWWGTRSCWVLPAHTSCAVHLPAGHGLGKEAVVWPVPLLLPHLPSPPLLPVAAARCVLIRDASLRPAMLVVLQPSWA